MTVKGCLNIVAGTFEYKHTSKDPVVSDIYHSIRELIYYDRFEDKSNIKNDVNNIQKDFKKATAESVVSK